MLSSVFVAAAVKIMFAKAANMPAHAYGEKEEFGEERG